MGNNLYKQDNNFHFLKIPNLGKWVISAPKRAKRPRLKGRKCVFCPGDEQIEKDCYRIGGEDHDKNWKVRVIKNKYPFTPIHDIVVLTPEHINHFSDISVEQTRFGIEAYVNRYNAYKDKGTVVIFGNSGHDAGESIGHPHAQIAVPPKNITIQTPKLEKNIDYWGEHFKIGGFEMICPPYSEWPDETWIVPLERGKTFGEISFSEIESLSYVWNRLIKIFEIRHGNKFPHNFYIYPYEDWYLRLIPRAKIPGGFEISTGIFVNTQNPRETMEFIKDHFAESEEKMIKKARARYRRGV
jgi:UDPglucose--hexose-1-phosphate uridylyltransferase